MLTMVPGTWRATRSVQQGAARRQPGRVDQRVDPAVPRHDGGHRGLRAGHIGDVGPDVLGTDLRGQRLADLGPAAGHHDGRTLLDGGPGDAGSDALRTAADEHHPVVQ